MSGSQYQHTYVLGLIQEVFGQNGIQSYEEALVAIQARYSDFQIHVQNCPECATALSIHFENMSTYNTEIPIETPAA